MNYAVVNIDELRREGRTYELEGYEYNDTNISLILVDMLPGDGVRLHSHPYGEIFIVHEGQATYTVGSATIEVRAGQIVIAPADVPHKFVNTGTGPLRQTDIHLNKEFITEWLED